MLPTWYVPHLICLTPQVEDRFPFLDELTFSFPGWVNFFLFHFESALPHGFLRLGKSMRTKTSPLRTKERLFETGKIDVIGWRLKQGLEMIPDRWAIFNFRFLIFDLSMCIYRCVFIDVWWEMIPDRWAMIDDRWSKNFSWGFLFLVSIMGC